MIYGVLFLEIYDQLVEAEVESSGDRIELASCSNVPHLVNVYQKLKFEWYWNAFIIFIKLGIYIDR